MRGATRHWCCSLLPHGVSIHAPRAGRDYRPRGGRSPRQSFNPRAPCGARRDVWDVEKLAESFNPRAPYGARQPHYIGICQKQLFQSTRPVRGATGIHGASVTVHVVSIHAPRAGRDLLCGCCQGRHWRFNPRAPCGARPWRSKSITVTLEFQSTRPVRGATTSSLPNPRTIRRFNPRAPCGARPPMERNSPHREVFQSTRPVRGATFVESDSDVRRFVSIHAPRAGRDAVIFAKIDSVLVSIHAPRAGRDSVAFCSFWAASCFNPRAPCGARPP